MIGTVAATVWAGIATLGVVVAAFVRLRSGIDETTIELWKEQAEAYKAKSERLESALTSLERRVEHLEQENKMLRQLHDNRDELAAISQILADGLTDIRNLLKDGR